ncbi:hypothetical protein FF38_09389 [Lucilia cuprina]|uniref:Uncharacterized protein n=1 Tax=Lucilia cuprina TaxID=7375 RepID=A0A0L0CQD8_LUCCU|nr:hypothetical protein FF38_09389 [Lucilia cuprina]
MSSSLEINKETKESLDNAGLSLFDQLKNSKDHNSVNKVATLKTTKILEEKPKNEIIDKTEDNFNKIPITASSSPSSLASAVEKPEFYPPSLPASQSLSSSLTASCNLGIVASNKRNSNQTNLFTSRDIQTLSQSLKRSQQNATKKSALSSSSKVLGNLLSSTSSSSSLSSLAAGVAAAALLKSACLAGDQTHLHHNHHHHHHHNHQHHLQQQHNKKKRCTDRYDSSESSDSLSLSRY